MSARHAMQPREDLHRADKRSFVQEVAAALNEANTRNEFDCLVLVAPAHALSDLRHALDAPTQHKIVAQLQKDLTKVPDAELKEHFAAINRA
jgi:protein required for attachment to host cells